MVMRHGSSSCPEGIGVIGVWREYLAVSRVCRALRGLCIEVRASNPSLRGTDLYEQVVRRHLGITAEAAARVVGLAGESFASWPTARPVTFRDVAHYLAATQLLQHHGCIAADIRGIVHRQVPAEW